MENLTFHIKLRNKNHIFDSAESMDKFIQANKKFLYNSYIILKSDDLIRGTLKISSYLKFNSDVKKGS